MATPDGGQETLKEYEQSALSRIDKRIAEKKQKQEEEDKKTNEDDTKEVDDTDLDESGDADDVDEDGADEEDADKKDGNENDEEGEDEDSNEDEEEMDEEELADSIEKIRREADSAISKKHERWYKSEKSHVEENPEHLLRLAGSDDDADIKAAKRIANELGYGSLGKAIAEIKNAVAEADKDAGDTNGEKEKKPEVSEALIEKRLRNKMTKESFEKTNPVLDPSSEKYNEAVANKFERVLNSLITIDEYTTDTEMKEALEDAFYTSSRGLNEKNYKEEARKAAAKIAAQKKLVSKSGAGTKGKSLKKEEPQTAKEKFRAFAAKVKSEQ